MPSPFPGMDPYLEAPEYWPGLHLRLIVGIGRELNLRLPDGYFAEIDEHVWLQRSDEESKPFRKPDVFVVDRNGAGNGPRRGRTASGATAAEPTSLTTLQLGKKKKHRYVKIVAPDHRTVVTVIELLSPSNKRGEGRDKYIDKREGYLLSNTNLVELDFLREGEPMPMGTPPPPISDYSIFVSTADRAPGAAVWSVTVRDEIPIIPVPLRSKDAETSLDLQSVFATVYDESRYQERIAYSLPPNPPLRRHDAEWAADLLKKHAKKRKK